MPANLLFPLRMLPAGSPAFAKNIVVRKKKIVSDFPIIVHETRPKAWQHWSKSSGIGLPDETRVIRLDSMIAVVRAAQRGIGAALVPVPVGDLWFKEGSIVALFKDMLTTDVSYYLVCKESRAKDDGVKLLREWIIRNFVEKA